MAFKFSAAIVAALWGYIRIACVSNHDALGVYMLYLVCHVFSSYIGCRYHMHLGSFFIFNLTLDAFLLKMQLKKYLTRNTDA